MRFISYLILVGFLLFITLSQVSVVDARGLNKSYTRKTYKSTIHGTYRIKYPAWTSRGR